MLQLFYLRQLEKSNLTATNIGIKKKNADKKN